ncbi:SIR2 family protein [Cobetia amphilecti]|uniref:SIR2 family protein n=1 Tax=Cobetia amphilecti TaxID=1055104 RepID=UPI00244A781E|nr:SIR2 family protein [Cobetia litoralis]MDH2421247.1 SIR2 family protein [Cobetia litoralis]
MIDDIMSSIFESGIRGRYSFETFVLNLLKEHIAKQDKPFSTSEKNQKLGDGYAEFGFDRFTGPTIVDIKGKASKLTLISAAFGLSARLERACADIDNLSNYIIVFGSRVSLEQRKLFDIQLAAKKVSVNKNVNVILWGLDDLDKLATKHKKKTKEIVDNIFSLRLEDAINKSTTDWISERDDLLLKLKSLYKDGQFSLFLGAGVSSSANMPNWEDLLNSLYVKYINNEFSDEGLIDDSKISILADWLSSVNDTSTLMVARYLRKALLNGSSEDALFTDQITESLYSNIGDKANDGSPLLTSIVAMCLPKRRGAKVKSIVTYNFDDLLERQLEKSKIDYKCIFSEGVINSPDELPVYHVHGFLPKEKDSFDSIGRSTLVFSEEGYHYIYTNAYHWTNLVQLNSLRDSSCLMIGLSMTDPNLRRLLDISARSTETIKHYAFLRRLTANRILDKNHEEGRVVIEEEVISGLLKRHHTLSEELMKDLGVKVVWYEDHKDLPGILDSIVD